jgi:hypothetical protein
MIRHDSEVAWVALPLVFCHLRTIHTMLATVHEGKIPCLPQSTLRSSILPRTCLQSLGILPIFCQKLLAISFYWCRVSKSPRLLISRGLEHRLKYRLPRSPTLTSYISTGMPPQGMGLCMVHPRPVSSRPVCCMPKTIIEIFNSRSTPYKSRKSRLFPYKESNPRQQSGARIFACVSPNALDKHIAQNMVFPTSWRKA